MKSNYLDQWAGKMGRARHALCCPGCGTKKVAGDLCCWKCFKSPVIAVPALKYFQGKFDEWVDLAIAATGQSYIPEPVVTAHCGPEFAKFMDPNGSLQRAGLLVVDLDGEE